MNNSKNKFENLKAVIFDLDGTLLDSFSVHYEVYETVFAKFGLHIEKKKFLETYSPNWYETYKAVGLSEDKWKLADNLWIEEAKRKKTFMYSGTEQVLNNLHENFTLGIVTSGSKGRVEQDLDNNNIKRFFKTIITGDDIENPKPHPEGLELAITKLGLQPKDAVYIGDAYDDFKMADLAGINFIGIISEFANLRKNDPQYQICKITEVPAMLGLKT